MLMFREWTNGITASFHLDTIRQVGRYSGYKHVNIWVLVADLRGSTTYQRDMDKTIAPNDPKAARFLSDYYDIFRKAVTKALWIRGVPNGDGFNGQNDFLIPKVLKLLGDGVMLVWELPNTGIDPASELTKFALDVVSFAQGYFRLMTLAAGHETIYLSAAQDLKVAFGLAAGPALRMKFGASDPWDYAGSVINLAHRLQSEATRGGIVVHVSSCGKNILQRIEATQRGKIQPRKIKGFDDKIHLWLCDDEQLPVISFRLESTRPQWNGLCLDGILPLAPDALLVKNGTTYSPTLKMPEQDQRGEAFQLRIAVEMYIAWAAAKRYRADKAKNVRQIHAQMKSAKSAGTFDTLGKQFHQEVARIADKGEAGEVIAALFQATNARLSTHDGLSKKDRRTVVDEHNAILDAIREGNASLARQQMCDHLTNKPRRWERDFE